MARPGGGKSGGFRTLVLFKHGPHVFFAHGFAKKDKANISTKELKALKQLADVLFGFSAAQIASAVQTGELIEVRIDDDDEIEGEA